MEDKECNPRYELHRLIGQRERAEKRWDNGNPNAEKEHWTEKEFYKMLNERAIAKIKERIEELWYAYESKICSDETRKTYYYTISELRGVIELLEGKE
jgi:hypothetical protein